MEQYTEIENKSEDNKMQNAKYVISAIGAGIFMAAAYYLPAETFLAFFGVVLFLIPTAIFVQMIQAMAKKEDIKGG